MFNLNKKKNGINGFQFELVCAWCRTSYIFFVSIRFTRVKQGVIEIYIIKLLARNFCRFFSSFHFFRSYFVFVFLFIFRIQTTQSTKQFDDRLKRKKYIMKQVCMAWVVCWFEEKKSSMKFRWSNFLNLLRCEKNSNGDRYSSAEYLHFACSCYFGMHLFILNELKGSICDRIISSFCNFFFSFARKNPSDWAIFQCAVRVLLKIRSSSEFQWKWHC